MKRQKVKQTIKHTLKFVIDMWRHVDFSSKEFSCNVSRAFLLTFNVSQVSYKFKVNHPLLARDVLNLFFHQTRYSVSKYSQLFAQPSSLLSTFQKFSLP
jgi:hypothetical protein